MEKVSVMVSLILAAALSPAPAARPEPALALDGLDPVALSEGREAKGEAAYSAARGRYRYRFTGPGTLGRFQQDPDRYAIQMAGACARMGVLSGLGSPSRWHVHEGRIYVFASDACRNTFRSAPGSFLIPVEAPPAGTPEEIGRGRAILGRAVEAMGGSTRLDALSSYEATIRIVTKSGGQSYEGRRTIRIAFPSSYHESERWGDSAFSHAVGETTGYRDDGGVVWPLEPVEIDEVRRKMARWPLVLLKARDQAGFGVVYRGRGEAAGIPVDLVAVGHAGATTTLGVEPATGRVVSASHVGRGPRGYVEVARIYSDFRDAGGLTLPYGLSDLVQGQPVADTTLAVESHVLDRPIDPAMFRPAD